MHWSYFTFMGDEDEISTTNETLTHTQAKNGSAIRKLSQFSLWLRENFIRNLFPHLFDILTLHFSVINVLTTICRIFYLLSFHFLSLSLHSARIPMEFRTQLLMSPFFYWTRKVTPQIKVVIENDNHFAHAEQSFSLRTYMDSCLVHRIPIKWSGNGSGCRGRDMFSLLLHWKCHVPCAMWVRERERV